MAIPQSINLMNGVTTNVAGSAIKNLHGNFVVQGIIDGTGAVSCTVVVGGSIRGRLFTALGTLSLTGTTTDSKKLAITEPWPFLQATTSSISGTGATVSVDAAGIAATGV